MQFRNFAAIDVNGRPIPRANVFVYSAGTTVAVSVYDEGGAQITDLKTDEKGLFSFSTADGTYDVRIVSGSEENTLENEQFFDALGSAQPLYPDRATTEATTIPTEIQSVAYYENGKRLEFEADDSGTALTTSGFRRWSPIGDVTWEHFNSSANTRSAALVAADKFARANGRRLVINDITLDAPVTLDCQEISTPGEIVLANDFAPGSDDHVIVYGSNNLTDGGRANVELNFNLLDYIGQAAGTWDASSGAFPSGSALNDSYKVTVAGTVDGTAFAVGDTLRSDIANASTSTYANNWTKRPYIAALQVTGVALGLGQFEVKGSYCDTIVDILGNSERTPYAVSGAFSHLVVRERSDAADPDNVKSPDNNSIRITGASCGQWYANEGTVVSDVYLQAQNSIANYGLKPVSIKASRKTTLSGCIRVAQDGCIEVDQDSNARTTGVIFNDLLVISPRNDKWLIVEETGQLSGNINVVQPEDDGFWIKRDNGSMLRIVVESQSAGTIGVFGDTAGATTCTRSRYEVVAARHDGATNLFDLQRVSRSNITYTGEPLPVSLTLASQSRLSLPSRFISSDVSITGDVEAEIEFIGAADAADFRAYSTPIRGMRGVQADGLQTPVFYTARGTADGWQQPIREDIGTTT